MGYSSCWLETATEPLFPFGYGLSYTTFEYGKTTIEPIPDRPGCYSVSATVSNTGRYDAQEVVQLYYRQRSGDLVRPICELKGFEKVFIPAGESRRVSFVLTPEDRGYWHEAHDGLNSRVWFAADDVDFEVWIAPDSRCQTEPAKIRL